MSNEPTRILRILRGLPGSGKSTIAEAWVAESPATRTRVNRDTIRSNYYNALWGESVDEAGVTRIEQEIVRAVMAKGERNIISDSTNLKDESVLYHLMWAKESGYAVEFTNIDVDYDELVRRDSVRDKPVGEAVLKMFWDNFTEGGKLLPPPTKYFGVKVLS